MDYVQQLYGFDEDDFNDLFLSHYDSIDHMRFYNYSSACYMMEKIRTGTKMTTMSLLKNEFEGTYFEMLPFELIELIMEIARIRTNAEDTAYYKKYFSNDESFRAIARSMRVRPGQEIAKKKDPRIKIVTEESPLGPIQTRLVYKNNMAAQCHDDFAKVIVNGVGNLTGFKLLYEAMKKWMVWVCDHSHIYQWERFMETIFEKIYELNDQLLDIEDGKKKNDCFTADELKETREVMKDILYFIEEYLPFVILSRSNNYIDEFNKVGDDDINYLSDLLSKIYRQTMRHPNDINIEEAYDFEMATYAPDYYFNVYKNYMTLRSGSILIPHGKRPCFFWCGDKYIQRFY